MSEELATATVTETVTAESTETTSSGGDILSSAPATDSTSTTTDEAPAPQWHDGLPEEVTSHKGFEGLKGKITSVDALAMSYMELQARMGGAEPGGLKAPTEDSTPEELGEFFKAAGRPETAGDYKFDGLPEGMELDTELLTERQDAMFQIGVSQIQYETLMGMHVEEINKIEGMMQTKQVELCESTKAKYEEEWGRDYDRNMKAVESTAQKHGVKDELMEHGDINKPAIIRILHLLNLGTAEDGIVKPQDSGYNRKAELKNVRAELARLPGGHPDRYALQQRQVKLSN